MRRPDTTHTHIKTEDTYDGFEVGPIRPPSEAKSLLLRVTRNCPWNRCTFCSLYKGEKFSIRPVSHVVRDIDLIKKYIDEIKRRIKKSGGESHRKLQEFADRISENEWIAFHSALNWFRGGMTSIFLQDANSLIMKPDDLVKILRHLRETFPLVKRITSYARSHSIARISDKDMARIAVAGLNRIHIGMESACDEVLYFVRKGVDKKTHIIAGQKVKRAGIELSEYFMPGLGGEQYSRANALETADAMNKINPDFIRIRTLALPGNTKLFKDYQSGAFLKSGDVKMAEEILLFLESLSVITSTVKSDHILNLFQEAEGRLPVDKEKMTGPIRKFLTMGPEDQVIFMIGRRAGIFTNLEDMKDPELVKQAERVRDAHQVTIDNVDDFTTEMMKRFI
jgi:radical SAM superfamily enzyme YgiQ (UPF0313 family)